MRIEPEIMAEADCGCRVFRAPGTDDIYIRFCDLHRAADELLKACEARERAVTAADQAKADEMIRAAITKARGK